MESGQHPPEIGVSFDITETKISCTTQVRRLGCKSAIQKIFDLNTEINEIYDFVKRVGGTGIGKRPECYEIVLRQVREEKALTPATKRSLKVIGDTIAYEPSNADNRRVIGWTEFPCIVEKNVRIYTAQYMSEDFNTQTKAPYKTKNGNPFKIPPLHLMNYQPIVDIMLAIVFRQKGVDCFKVFEIGVRAREGAGICSELDRMLITLAERQDNVQISAVSESPLSKPETPASQNSAVGDAPHFKPETSASQSSAVGDSQLYKLETSIYRMGDTTSPTTSTMEDNRLTLDDVKPSFMKGNQLTSQDGVKPSLNNIRDGTNGKPRTDNKKKYSSRKTMKKDLANTATERPSTRSRMAKHVEKWKWWI